MGLFDKKNRGLFNGIFDFNMDGKSSLFEDFIVFEMLEEEEKKTDNNLDENLDDEEYEDIIDEFDEFNDCAGINEFDGSDDF